jgi:hypothetical protein
VRFYRRLSAATLGKKTILSDDKKYQKKTACRRCPSISTTRTSFVIRLKTRSGPIRCRGPLNIGTDNQNCIGRPTRRPLLLTGGITHLIPPAPGLVTSPSVGCPSAQPTAANEVESTNALTAKIDNFMSTLQKPQQAPILSKKGVPSGTTISVNVLYRAQSKLDRSI